MSRDTIRLPRDAYRLLQTLRAAGHSAYVVGGCVRDSLLGRLPGDWDICTSARPDQLRAIFHDQRLILTGEKHGTVAVILHGKPYEITTYRLDGSYRDHRHPDSVQFVDDLAADLARRDFTVNAMAYTPGEGIIDLYGGRRDLAAGIVRCVGAPADRFAEDALRILRLYRFAARFGFSIDPPTAQAAQELCAHLDCVSVERIEEELAKLLSAPAPAAYLDKKILLVILPELSSEALAAAKPVAIQKNRMTIFRHNARISIAASSGTEAVRARLVAAGLGLYWWMRRRKKNEQTATDSMNA